jgi:hypothetical protein
LGAKSFTGEPIGHRAFTSVREKLVSLGLIEHTNAVQRASKDPYALPGFGPDARRVIKGWFTATFGNGSHLAKWPSKSVRDYRERTGCELGNDYKVAAIREESTSLCARRRKSRECCAQ